MSLASKKPTLAFLGPRGTYSHQAAFDCFGGSVFYEEKQTIAEVFYSVTPEIPLGLVPHENSIYGAVVETCNLLRSSLAGRDIVIRGDVTLKVNHCLVVRSGVKLENIEHVLSHEQALGQCKAFIAKYLPHATLVPTDSTASAAQILVSPKHDGLDPLKCGAICSQVVTTIMDGLEVLSEGIQDEDTNFTRFYVLSWGKSTTIPPPVPDLSQPRALVRLSYPPEKHFKFAPKSQDLTPLLVALGLCITRIDRRPSTYSIPFHDVFFVEATGDELAEDAEEDISWTEKVRQGVERVKQAGGEVCVIGTW
ncbi:PDT-domain-containing protein [Leucogyrophana mollusca]|uniref:PDT-domain-containing protein n=1 Tax=Leucogyrophana mollusca TaxID=85980 RepID=A0ACB8BZF9_9AGAM|nr:PDT-domain-containing protein [Leucogyrophana mollusca]